MFALFDWLLGLIDSFSQFLGWLTQELPYINMSPLTLVGFTGITAVVVFLLIRLVVGG